MRGVFGEDISKPLHLFFSHEQAMYFSLLLIFIFLLQFHFLSPFFSFFFSPFMFFYLFIIFAFLLFSLFSFHSHFYLTLTNLTWRKKCEDNLFPFMYK